MRRIVIAIAFAAGLAVVVVPAAAQPGSKPTADEMRPQGRSGFWTNPYPAKNGAYRWRLLGLGCAIALTTGLVMWKLVKKANAERAAGIRR